LTLPLIIAFTVFDYALPLRRAILSRLQ